jgi:Icc-related predicted phosphoesterase
MKFLFASDLHGDTRLYQELLETALARSAEVIAFGGDLFPSYPPTKRYEDMIPNQVIFIDQFLRGFFEKIIKATAVKEIFLIPGNWDIAFPYLLNEPMEGVVDISQRIHRLNTGYELIGYPFVPPSPFRPKDFEKRDDPDSPWPPQKNPSYIRSPGRMDRFIPIDPFAYVSGRETIREDLAGLPRPMDPKRTIYVMHSPPWDTRLDRIHGGSSAGSRSIKAFIQAQQPLLTLHGHIHESMEISGNYLDRIGETLSVNPGQSFGAGGGPSKLHAVTFEMEKPEETITHTCL